MVDMAHTNEDRAVLEAAEVWVRRIQDDPKDWADSEDEALIAAVLAANPHLHAGGEWDGYRVVKPPSALSARTCDGCDDPLPSVCVACAAADAEEANGSW